MSYRYWIPAGQLENRPITGAVKVMTIHQSKGLESPVVILFDPFSIGQGDSTLASKDHIKITPDLIAPQFNPWPGKPLL